MGNAFCLEEPVEVRFTYVGETRPGPPLPLMGMIAHGKGVRTWEDGRVLEGTFEDNHAKEGVCQSANGVHCILSTNMPAPENKRSFVAWSPW